MQKFLGVPGLQLLGGGALIAAAAVATHFLVLSSLLAPCTTNVAAGPAVLSILLALVLCTLGVFCFMHLRRSQWRFIGAFLMAFGTVSLDLSDARLYCA